MRDYFLSKMSGDRVMVSAFLHLPRTLSTFTVLYSKPHAEPLQADRAITRVPNRDRRHQRALISLLRPPRVFVRAPGTVFGLGNRIKKTSTGNRPRREGSSKVITPTAARSKA